QAPVGGVIATFAGGPQLLNIGAMVNVPVGNTTVPISAPVIDGLFVSPGITVVAVRGIESGALSHAAGWTLVELVGLPVKAAAWAGIGKHGTPQGLVGAFVDAQTAAIQRLQRGAPPVGWAALLAAGFPAPLWAAPSFPGLVTEVNVNLLSLLR